MIVYLHAIRLMFYFCSFILHSYPNEKPPQPPEGDCGGGWGYGVSPALLAFGCRAGRGGLGARDIDHASARRREAGVVAGPKEYTHGFAPRGTFVCFECTIGALHLNDDSCCPAVCVGRCADDDTSHYSGLHRLSAILRGDRRAGAYAAGSRQTSCNQGDERHDGESDVSHVFPTSRWC